jgi:hypothetical protein
LSRQLKNEPYSRSQTLLSASGAPLPDQSTPFEGARLAQSLALPVARQLGMQTAPAGPSDSGPMDLEPAAALPLIRTTELLTHVDPRAHRLAWRLPTPVPWLLWTERWQVLSEVEVESPESKEGSEASYEVVSRRGYGEGSGGGKEARGTRTRYETWEVVGGALAYPLIYLVLAPLQAAFEASSRALKERAEAPRAWSWG